MEDWVLPKRKWNIPVMEFLLSLPPKLRAKAYREIELLHEHGIYLKEPYVKAIKGEQYKELYELRIKLGSDASKGYSILLIIKPLLFYWMVS